MFAWEEVFAIDKMVKKKCCKSMLLWLAPLTIIAMMMFDVTLLIIEIYESKYVV